MTTPEAIDEQPATPADRQPWQPSRTLAALCGVVAVALAVAVGEVVAAVGGLWNWFAQAGSPSAALGAAFIDLTPEWLKEFAIRTFGQNDKVALQAGMGVTVLVLAVVIGLLLRRTPRWSVAVAGAGVVVAAVAVLTRPGTRVVDVLPTLLAGVVGVCFLIAIARRLVPVAVWPDDGLPTGQAPKTVGQQQESMPGAVSRRSVLRLAGIGAVAAAALAVVGRIIPSAAEVEASRSGVSLRPPTDTVPIPDVDLDVPGLTSFITGNDAFYRVDTAFTVPRVTAEQWRLRVHGMVDEPFELTFAELSALPLIERPITLQCVSNEVGGDLNGTAMWLGARLSDLIDRAKPQAGADAVLSTSVDGFTVTTPLAALTDGRDALLAIGMNGEPLPLQHGFPVRMVVPGLYGYVSATKWVVDLQITRFADVSAYWTDRGWSAQAPIKTQSRIDVPAGFAKLPAGTVAVAGMAWAQHRGVAAVEVQIDDGPWQPAELSAPVSIDTWRQWVYRWDATPGMHTIRCRATDSTGETQTSTVQPIMPDGATGYDSRTVTIT